MYPFPAPELETGYVIWRFYGSETISDEYPDPVGSNSGDSTDRIQSDDSTDSDPIRMIVRIRIQFG